MSLLLTVTSYRGATTAQAARKSLGPQGGVIGRAAGCDWQLPDPEETLSKRHCRIVPDGPLWRLVDTSTNGVFVNQSPKRVGYNADVVLRHGDVLSIGEYVIRVEIDDGAASQAEPMPGFDPGSPAAALAPLFGDRPAPGPLYEGPPFAPPRPLIPASENWLASPAPDHAPIEQHVIRIPEARVPEDFARNVLPPDYDPLAESKPVSHPPAGSAAAPAAAPRFQPQAPSAPAVAAFLDGAGLSRAQLGAVSDAELMRAAGQRLRELASGLRQLLRMRAQIKSELRVDHTVIAASGNSPLKFAADDASALLALLVPQRGYIAPTEAVAEGFRDLQQHELALLAGARQAIAAAVEHFAPKVLADRLDKGGKLAALLPVTRKARYWDLFESEFLRVAEEAEEGAHGPLARALARAYEDQKGRT